MLIICEHDGDTYTDRGAHLWTCPTCRRSKWVVTETDQINYQQARQRRKGNRRR